MFLSTISVAVGMPRLLKVLAMETLFGVSLYLV